MEEEAWGILESLDSPAPAFCPDTNNYRKNPRKNTVL